MNRLSTPSEAMMWSSAGAASRRILRKSDGEETVVVWKVTCKMMIKCLSCSVSHGRYLRYYGVCRIACFVRLDVSISVVWLVFAAKFLEVVVVTGSVD